MADSAQQVLRGRFELLEEIGEGGFARVFRARETTTGRKVALKVLKDGFKNDPEVMERFRREVFAVASIDSPHVVGLADFGISGDEFFIAMEFVEGPTLRDVIDQTEWSADTVHSIVGQIASALIAAHAQNIVHRDLKPENVMLVQGPNDTMMVKVLDFGLAKLAELERNLGLAPLTRVGMCFGTPQYMSPELIYGKPVDPSVDLFALGVIAYELIAGRRPWDAEQPQEVLVAVARSPLPPITKVHASIAPRLDILNQLFARVLAKKKADRPPTAAALFAELSIALFGQRRELVMPSLRDLSADLSIVQARLPVANPRPDETQLDLGGRLAERLPDKTLELSAYTGPVPEVPVGRRSGKLPAKWVNSIGGTPSLELPIEPMPPITAKDPLPAPVESSGPSVVTIIVILILALALAAGVGFVIGRGH